MARAIASIRSHEAELTAAGIDRASRVRLDAVVRQLMVIGEAVTHLDEATTAPESDVPWRDIRGARIIFGHVYFRVSPDLVWTTVDRDLDPLDEAVRRLLDEDHPDV